MNSTLNKRETLKSLYGMTYFDNERFDHFIKSNRISKSDENKIIDVIGAVLNKTYYAAITTINFRLKNDKCHEKFIQSFIGQYEIVFNEIFKEVFITDKINLCKLLNKKFTEYHLEYKEAKIEFVMTKEIISDETIYNGFIFSPIPYASKSNVKSCLCNTLKDSWIDTIKNMNYQEILLSGPRTFYNVITGGTDYTTKHFKDLHKMTKFAKTNKRSSKIHMSEITDTVTEIQNMQCNCEVDGSAPKEPTKKIKAEPMSIIESMFLDGEFMFGTPKGYSFNSKHTGKSILVNDKIIKKGDRYVSYQNTYPTVKYADDLLSLRKTIKNHVRDIVMENSSVGILPFTCEIENNLSIEELKAKLKMFFRYINGGIKKNFKKTGESEFNVKYVWNVRGIGEQQGVEVKNLMLRFFILYPRDVFKTPNDKYYKNESLADIVSKSWFKEFDEDTIFNWKSMYVTKKIIGDNETTIQFNAEYFTCFSDRKLNVDKVINTIVNEFDNGFFTSSKNGYGLSRNTSKKRF